ncbi:MAG TPA: PVC-type heme-binding CxxCH protein, partial [Gemmataceae bacterium]
MKKPILLLGLFVLSVAAAHAQLPPEKAAATFKVADGLEMSLWASEPLFVNPTCIDIDHKGRVWVCESVNYRNKLHGKKTLNRPEGDRIVILEDTKGTGKADKAITFYQSPELLAPLGIAVAAEPSRDRKGAFSYKVYICQSPDILLFEDKDGDGKADGPPKKLLSGFGGFDHDHGVHGILIGPDGKLYFSVGDTGVHGLQSSDGKGRKWQSNNTDCRAGTIWRCDLDGKNLELIAHNFRNEYEPCVDSFGTVFVSDNDDDGNQQTRICYVMPGGNYGYHPRGPGQSHWHEEQPGVVPKILRTGFGSPTGMCVYEGTLLPKKYWGQLLHT